ncbi:hypothetical protein K8T06_06590 [bacterium]|nr:hypothetical protein [bacterium]
MTLGSIIGAFKSRCVIENLRYIKDNPKIWAENENNPKNIGNDDEMDSEQKKD